MMTNGWQTVQLGDVLKRVKSELTIDDSVVYKQVTVRLWNKGVILRGEQEGADIKTKRQYYVKTGQLLMSRIDVRNGAIGLVPKELDGAIVSNDFWVYDFDENQIYPDFLALYVKTLGFIDDANRTSSGTTKRIRADETAFLNINIPLPPLTEQRRIVEDIELLAARVNEAQRLREEAEIEAEAFISSTLHKVFDDLEKQFGTTQISQFAEVKGGKRLPAGNTLNDLKTPYVYIRVTDMKNHSVELADLKYVPEHLQPAISRYTVSSKDVYVTIAGTIGYPGLIPDELDGANLTENAAKLVFHKPDEIDKRFVVYALRSPQVQDQFGQKQTLAAQPKLALHRIRFN